MSRGAWFFPYTFDFAVHGIAADTMRAPWYSGMAQGQALSLFVRLDQATGTAPWRTAADSTAPSFALPPAAGLPGVVHVDAAGSSWLDEYPLTTTRDDLTFNGHNFAIFGLYDYARQTGDVNAALLFDGTAGTALKYGTSGIRVPNWVSYYCLTHRVPAGSYHDIHLEQLLTLYSMTRYTVFARLSDSYRDDFPHDGASTVRFSAGSHTGHRFDAAGTITATKVLVLSAVSTAPASRYAKIKGQGRELLVSAGSLSGYWVPDAPNVTAAIGPFTTATYTPWRTATFPNGNTTGFHFDAMGMPGSSKVIVIKGSSTAPFDQPATFNGTRYVRIAAGSLSGYWVPATLLVLT